jgi:hypothetical protein
VGKNSKVAVADKSGKPFMPDIDINRMTLEDMADVADRYIITCWCELSSITLRIHPCVLTHFSDFSYPPGLKYPSVPYEEIGNHPDDFYDTSKYQFHTQFQRPRTAGRHSIMFFLEDLLTFSKSDPPFHFFSREEIDVKREKRLQAERDDGHEILGIMDDDSEKHSLHSSQGGKPGGTSHVPTTNTPPIPNPLGTPIQRQSGLQRGSGRTLPVTPPISATAAGATSSSGADTTKISVGKRKVTSNGATVARKRVKRDTHEGVADEGPSTGARALRSQHKSEAPALVPVAFFDSDRKKLPQRWR